ncbi:MAG: tRNA (guanosine(46)-N7)-methyltransferase TrmB [Sphingobacteriales bacterium]|nr:tRNA (guanosine(46)-N7)-methyltransferase TrmB [Sphingobacteriales bacterium]
MGQKKLIRFAELSCFSNVLQLPENMAGNWTHHFKNENPLTLELACGKGEYTLGLARLYPQRNFIGIDIKGNRIWVGAKKAIQENLNRVAFLRTQIEQLHEYFAPNEVNEIWITFPDPQLRFSKAKKRLTHPRFLRLYQQILKPSGKIHLKTDSPDLYRFTKEVLSMYQCNIIADIDDVYGQTVVSQELSIKTHYEALDIAQSSRIHYLCFTLPEQIAGVEMDLKLKEAIRYELER